MIIPGDLHHIGSHVVASIYSLFYGGFIQTIQLTLGCKHIDIMKAYKALVYATMLMNQTLP